MSRRQFLAGALVAGGAGWAAACTRRPLPVGEASVVRVPGPAGGVLVSGRFASDHMHRALAWALSVPSGQPEGTIYCLHGYREDHRLPFEQIGLPEVAAVLNARVAVASVDGGDGYWHARADGTNAQAMVLDEFLPLVEAYTHTTRRALLGWSMGGYGALLAAERAPAQFRAVAAASPALWVTAAQAPREAFDGPADYQRNDVFAGVDNLASLAVRVDCGSRDPFFRATEQFVARLRPGHQGSFGPAGHDLGYWRSIAPGQVATILAAFRT